MIPVIVAIGRGCVELDNSVLAVQPGNCRSISMDLLAALLNGVDSRDQQALCPGMPEAMRPPEMSSEMHLWQCLIVLHIKALGLLCVLKQESCS